MTFSSWHISSYFIGQKAAAAIKPQIIMMTHARYGTGYWGGYLEHGLVAFFEKFGKGLIVRYYYSRGE